MNSRQVNYLFDCFSQEPPRPLCRMVPDTAFCICLFAHLSRNRSIALRLLSGPCSGNRWYGDVGGNISQQMSLLRALGNVKWVASGLGQVPGV
jgi:hypothetical protein